mgnify:CR=1 FL=1
MERFVLLTTQRSGSSWVIDTLNSHPAVVAYSELFLRTNKESPTWAGDTQVLLFQAFLKRKKQKGFRLPISSKARICLKYLESIHPSNDQTEVESVGFKLMYNQMIQNAVCLLFYILTKKPIILHLIRRNYLDVILSEETAQARRMSHARHPVEQVKINLDTRCLVARLKRKERKIKLAHHIFSMLGQHYQRVYYEDLVSGKTSFRDVLSYIGITMDDKLSSNLQKLNQGTHRDLIQNYDEVKETLEETRFTHLLQ